MKTQFKIATTIFLTLILLFGLRWVSNWDKLSVHNVSWKMEAGTPQNAQLPFSTHYIGHYYVDFEVSGVDTAQHNFRFYPDDELIQVTVNGVKQDISAYSQEQRRNYTEGFIVSLMHLNPNQINKVEVQLKNESNPAGFKVEPVQRLTYKQLAGIYLLLIAFCWVLSRHLPIAKTQAMVIALSFALSCAYLLITDARTRTFDVFEGGGHRDYIEYLLQYKTMPPPGEGWEYHQPPLYYTAAGLFKIMIPNGHNDTDLIWAQVFALFLWGVFLMACLASLRVSFNRNPLLLFLASLTLCLWPSGIIHSIRIGNDLAIYACYGLTFYYTLRWWKRRHVAHLFWASVWMAASLVCKSNGLAVAAVLGVLLLMHIWGRLQSPKKIQRYKGKLIKEAVLVGGMFFTALAVNFSDNVVNYLNGTSKDWLLSNVSQMINPGLKVANNVENYLIFDSATFIKNPFISTWVDEYGRQYFWNFVLRSSLTSEFSFPGKALQTWGVVNGVLLLCSIMGLLIYFIQVQPMMKLEQFKVVIYRYAPWILAAIFPFVLLLAYRVKVPLSCNTDFRYIYPVILPCLYFTYQALGRSKRYPIARVLLSLTPLISASTLFWIFVLLQ